MKKAAKKKPSKKTPAQEAAALLGKLGGKARAENLTPEELSAIGKAGGDASVAAGSQSAAGKVGGKARAEAMTSERRKEIAKKAAEARWGKKKGDSTPSL